MSGEEAVTRQLLRARLAEPCARIYLELRLLLASVRAARKKDASMPKFTSKLLNHGALRAAGDPKPVTPPTPAVQPEP